MVFINVLCLDQQDTLHRVCCAAKRGFVLHVCDQANQVRTNFNYFYSCIQLFFKEIMRISREFKCCARRCNWCADIDCCAHEILIESPPGVILGSVRQT